VPCHLGHRAETLSTAQHANRAVLARFLFYRAGPGFVLLNSCRARAGPMSTAQTNRTTASASWLRVCCVKGVLNICYGISWNVSWTNNMSIGSKGHTQLGYTKEEKQDKQVKG
jgi:bacteriorhodopsin